MATGSEILLSKQQQSDLRSIAQSRALPAGYVFRAKLILMLAEGSSFNAIKRQLQTTAPTIVRWKQRFQQYGLEGLDTYHPGQKPRVLTPALRARILSATRRKPSDGSTHWSCRKLASALGVSKDAVHRVWQEAGLKPHRLERYMASDDPDFESKAADILGLYLHPPQHAAVFCIDEKTAIQALDRLDPVLPLSPGRAERHGFEYYRHGTLSLYAALNTATGRVHGKTAARHTSHEFVAFLQEVVSLCPPRQAVRNDLTLHFKKLFAYENCKVYFHVSYVMIANPGTVLEHLNDAARSSAPAGIELVKIEPFVTEDSGPSGFTAVYASEIGERRVHFLVLDLHQGVQKNAAKEAQSLRPKTP